MQVGQLLGESSGAAAPAAARTSLAPEQSRPACVAGWSGPPGVPELDRWLADVRHEVSGVLADLDRAGFIERHPDPADRRRTIVAIPPAQRALVGEWLTIWVPPGDA